MTTCLWCGQELRFVAGQEWLHSQGGLYYQKCKSCGHRAALRPSPVKCPKCGEERGWVDEHCAQPRAS